MNIYIYIYIDIYSYIYLYIYKTTRHINESVDDL